MCEEIFVDDYKDGCCEKAGRLTEEDYDIYDYRYIKYVMERHRDKYTYTL